MKKILLSSLLLLCLSLSFLMPQAESEALQINFDQKMLNLWTKSAWWDIFIATDYLPEAFSLHPDVCDINGGFDISVKPIELYPNNMLESDEFALIAAILADPSYDATARGGVSHQMVYDAWTQNFNQIRLDLGCCVGGPENVFTMFPDIDYLIAALITLGDQDSLAFPMILLDLVVNNDTVAQLVHDPNVRMIDLDNYKLMREYLAWCGDADGDGCSNFSEYSHFKAQGGRAAYLNAAMNFAQRPPGCTGKDRLCDGTGGLHAEYFNTRFMTDLAMTRIDQQVTFNGGRSAPSSLVNANDFTVCWTGWVIPDYTENYTFYTRTDDGVRLWVDNELLVDQWKAQSSTTYTAVKDLALVAGKKYPIRMDYYEQGGDAVAWLGWSSPRQTNGKAKAIYEINTKPGIGLGDRASAWIQNPNNGHMYKLTEPLSWFDGRTRADSLGVYMVTVNDERENQWIRHTFGVLDKSIYIGANDIDEEGRWVWQENGTQFWSGVADGSAVNGRYSNWNSNEPNNYNDHEDCGMMYGSSGKWNDLSGTALNPVLLEKNAGVVIVEGPFPANATIRAGKKFQFQVDVLQSWGTISYQWTHNGVDIPGATSDVLNFDPVVEEDAGLYACRLTDGTGAHAETGTAALSVTPGGVMPLLHSASLLLLVALLMSIVGAGALYRRNAAL